jgi:hypothetical protein
MYFVRKMTGLRKEGKEEVNQHEMLCQLMEMCILRKVVAEFPEYSESQW